MRIKLITSFSTHRLGIKAVSFEGLKLGENQMFVCVSHVCYAPSSSGVLLNGKDWKDSVSIPVI